MRGIAVAVAILVFLPGVSGGGSARAEPPGMTPVAPARRDPPPRRKSPAIALGLSLGFTAAGAAAVASDVAGGPELGPAGVLLLYIGPSTGRWYGGGGAAVGLLGRTAGGVVMIKAISDAMNRPEDEGHGLPLFLTGAAIWTAATVYDLVRAPLDARDHNRERGLAIAPTVAAGGAGLALGGQF